jgi:hypothetical protein
LPLYQTDFQDHGLEAVLDLQLIEKAQPAILNNEPVFANFEVKNTDRALGTMLSNEVSKVHKGAGLAPDTINFKFHGSAGQSFGAFAAKGLTLSLRREKEMTMLEKGCLVPNWLFTLLVTSTMYQNKILSLVMLPFMEQHLANFTLEARQAKDLRYVILAQLLW